MYLVDTNVISELGKKRVNGGVRAFFDWAEQNGNRLHLSVVTVGELERGLKSLRHKGDMTQATRVECWLVDVMRKYDKSILKVDRRIGKLWGELRVPHHENPVDKLIAATALVHRLTVVTRNTKDFNRTGARVLNPFK